MALAEGAWYVTSNSAGSDLVFKESLNMADRAKYCLQEKTKKNLYTVQVDSCKK
jgi:hypothetical protein